MTADKSTSGLAVDEGPAPTSKAPSCAYCGRPATTRDHVPPACIFGDLLKTDHGINLITVPACAACNHSNSQDDTYFRDAIFLIAGGRTLQPAPLVTAPIKRSLEKAGTEQWTPVGSFLKSATDTYFPLGSSDILQPAKAMPMSWKRLRRTAERVVRGLYWHHTKQLVPAEFDVHMLGDKEREKHGASQREEFSELAHLSMTGERRIVHADAFMYSIAFTTDDARAAIVLLAFYRAVLFLGLVGPKVEKGRIIVPSH